MKKHFLAVVCVLAFMNSKAQDKGIYSFNKISPTDFQIGAPKFDSAANAVIIADVGSTKFEPNNKGFFTLVFTRHIRVKVLNKNGYDVGDNEILLYNAIEQTTEKITSIKGVTYNLEDGVIKETTLDETSIFNETYSKNYNVAKFSMPALKAGSIYDLEYTIRSPFDIHMRSWEFQGKYPRLWSEYEVTIPPPFHFVLTFQGDGIFDIDTTRLIYGSFSVRGDQGVYGLSGNSTYRRWVKKNIPSLHEEPYITSMFNYNSRVSFQLNYFQWNTDTERHDYMSTWTMRCKELLADESFGLPLTQDNNWIYDDVKSITSGTRTDQQKAVQIYNWVRDNFKCVSDRGMYTHGSLKDFFKKREGNVAEINLLLAVLLRKAGVDADLMILSTRDNGVANSDYPMIDEYNYVICIAYVADADPATLDASQPFNGYGELSAACYNGYGHVISVEKPIPAFFSPDSLKEIRTTNVLVMNDEKGNLYGNFKSSLGKNESYKIRKEIGESSLKQYEQKLQTLNGNNLVMENFEADSLYNYSFPVTLHYNFDLKNVSSIDIIYFTPMIDEGFKINPFASIERHYPVEMPYQIDETYVLNMDIPTGYRIDEMPKSERVLYNNNEGMFEYIIQKGTDNMQLLVHLKLNKTFFPVDEYKNLRDFFAFVVKKENEQIVFKKIK